MREPERRNDPSLKMEEAMNYEDFLWHVLSGPTPQTMVVSFGPDGDCQVTSEEGLDDYLARKFPLRNKTTEPRNPQNAEPTKKWYFELCGYTREDIKISYDYTTRYLRVDTEKRDHPIYSVDKFPFGVVIPKEYDEIGITAVMTDGLLTITATRKTDPEPVSIKIG